MVNGSEAVVRSSVPGNTAPQTTSYCPPMDESRMTSVASGSVCQCVVGALGSRWHYISASVPSRGKRDQELVVAGLAIAIGANGTPMVLLGIDHPMQGLCYALRVCVREP